MSTVNAVSKVNHWVGQLNGALCRDSRVHLNKSAKALFLLQIQIQIQIIIIIIIITTTIIVIIIIAVESFC